MRATQNRWAKRGTKKQAEELDLDTIEASLREHDEVIALADRPRAERPDWVPFTERQPVTPRPKLDKKAEAIAAAKLAKDRAGYAKREALPWGYGHTVQAWHGLQAAWTDTLNWVWDPRGRSVLEYMAMDKDKDGRKKYSAQKARYNDRLKKRAGAAAGAVFLGFPVAVFLLWTVLGMVFNALPIVTVIATPLTVLSLLAIIVTSFSLYGRRRRPLPKTRVQERPKPQRPSADMFIDAFTHAGIEGVHVVGYPRAVAGGWEALLTMPRGKTFEDAVAKKNAIAGNLGDQGITSERLFLDPVKGTDGSERKVTLWMAPHDPMDPAVPSPVNPLLADKVERHDLWKDGIPLGVDARGNAVAVPIIFSSMLIMAQPRVGKTVAAMNALVAALLDPDVLVDVACFKPSGDYAPLKPLLRTYIGNEGVDGDKAPERLLAHLRALKQEVIERNRRLSLFPVERVPEGKLTEEIMRDPEANMKPIVLLIDEFQTVLGMGDIGKAILKEVEELARVAPSQGVSVIVVMQRTTREDIGNLKSYLGSRLCLSVTDWQDSAMCLGSAHSKEKGIDASQIPITKKGVGFIKGGEDCTLGDRPAFLMRTYEVNRTHLVEVVKRASSGCRAKANVVELHKGGHDPLVEQGRAAFEPGEELLAISILAERLGIDRRKIKGRLVAAGIEPEMATTNGLEDQGIGKGAQYVAFDQFEKAA